MTPRRRGGRCLGALRGLPALALPALAAAGLHRGGETRTNRSGPGGDGGAMVQLIGLREKLQENAIFHGKIYGFLYIFP